MKGYQIFTPKYQIPWLHREEMCQDETLWVVACDRAQRIKCCISRFLRFGGFAAFFLYFEALKITD